MQPTAPKCFPASKHRLPPRSKECSHSRRTQGRFGVVSGSGLEGDWAFRLSPRTISARAWAGFAKEPQNAERVLAGKVSGPAGGDGFRLCVYLQLREVAAKGRVE